MTPREFRGSSVDECVVGGKDSLEDFVLCQRFSVEDIEDDFLKWHLVASATGFGARAVVTITPARGYWAKRGIDLTQAREDNFAFKDEGIAQFCNFLECIAFFN